MTNEDLLPVFLDYHLGEGVTAFSTTREGGISEGAYAHFNITHYCGDAPEHVEQNRQLLCQKLGIHNNCLHLPHQTHNDVVYRIDDEFLKRSSEERQAVLEGVDALITDLRGQCIGVSTADCIPILLYDPIHQAIAAIHAGWRGTVARIVKKTIASMTEAFGTEAKDLKAVIGPGISQAAFEVGNEVYEAFQQAGFPMEEIATQYKIQQSCKWHIDLWAANFIQLEEAGMPLTSIQVSGICTFTEHERFFSARRLGIESGRIFNGIMLR